MTKYAYDPELVKLAELLAPPPPATTLGEVMERRDMLAGRAPQTQPGEGIRREDLEIPGMGSDPDVHVRVYRPDAAGEHRPLPALIVIHGGAFIMGTIDSMDEWCDHVAGLVPAVVVSVDYRLAPEHPFPAAFHDCYAVLEWLSAAAGELGVDQTRIAVSGVSAGGCLTAAVALYARDNGGPAICLQHLRLPCTDHRVATPSATRFVDTAGLNREWTEWAWNHYLGVERGDVSPYASPALATDFAGLPPAFIAVAEFDPVRDDGLEYGRQLLEAGVSAEIHCYAGAFHGSAMAADAAITRRQESDSVQAIVRALRRSP